jgi:cell division protein ZapA
MEERSIRVELAGRAYPLTVQVSEEVNVRRAVDEINESMDRLKKSYPLIDRQDLLAMAALEVTVRAMNSTAPQHEAENTALVEGISRLLSEALP